LRLLPKQVFKWTNGMHIFFMHVSGSTHGNNGHFQL